MSVWQAVELPGEKGLIRGRLYSHDTARPCVIMGHGYSATVDGMVADAYAEVLHRAGLAVLLFDHEGFGHSDGEPRRVINRWLQCRGYQHALDHAATLDAVDPSRLALWGDSLSGSVVLTVGAFDERVAALVVQVPACGRSVGPADPDGSSYRALRAFYAEADVIASADVSEPMPVVSPDQSTTPSLLEPATAFEWFTEYGGRDGSTWVNNARTAASVTPVPYFTDHVVPHLRCPSLWIIAEDDEMPGAEPEVALHCFELAGGAASKVLIDGGHFGLLYPDRPAFARSSQTQAAFLVTALGADAP